MAEKSTSLEKSVIHDVINALMDHLRKDYVFPDVANEAVRYIEKRLIDGESIHVYQVNLFHWH